MTVISAGIASEGRDFEFVELTDEDFSAIEKNGGLQWPTEKRELLRTVIKTYVIREAVARNSPRPKAVRQRLHELVEALQSVAGVLTEFRSGTACGRALRRVLIDASADLEVSHKNRLLPSVPVKGRMKLFTDVHIGISQLEALACAALSAIPPDKGGPPPSYRTLLIRSVAKIYESIGGTARVGTASISRSVEATSNYKLTPFVGVMTVVLHAIDTKGEIQGEIAGIVHDALKGWRPKRQKRG